MPCFILSKIMSIFILGQGGQSEEFLDYFLVTDKVIKDFGGFIELHDDKAILFSDSGTSDFHYSADAQFILGVGTKKVRKVFLEHLKKRYTININTFPNIISEKAHVSKLAKLGFGNVVAPFASIAGNAKIGNLNLFNIHSGVFHDCKVGDNNLFCPYSSLLGTVTIGNTNFFGANSTVTPKITIGDDNTISAGECLFDDLADREFFQSGIIQVKK